MTASFPRSLPLSVLRAVRLGLAALLLLAGRPCLAPAAAQAAEAYAMQAQRQPDFKRMQALGRAMFFDAALSASGEQSCGSCHDPASAYGPPNGKPVQPGGRDGQALGFRATPSLRYLQNVPPFTEHRFDDDVDESVDQGPAGGHDWDGRAATVHEQSGLALLSPNEMANASPAEVVERLRRAPYAGEFRATFGADALDAVEPAFQWALLALEMFQQDAAQFHPYSSKYDAVLRGRASLSPQEARGLALFNDETKGNCASCHPSAISATTGAFPAFTDHGHIAVGVPRNRELPANRDAGFHDLGLCGPERRDLVDRPEHCGAFRTPTLRNVALRQAFFHNGVLHTLDEVMQFYVTRDLEPKRWYGTGADGQVQPYDDLPGALKENVNRDPPFDRVAGDKPALDAREIADVIAFLKTLTDGYVPGE